MPLWFNRLRSKKLLDAIINYKDFPILAETWRTCLNDNFDLINLKLLLTEIDQGIIEIKETFTTVPSPFADNLIWQQTNKYMYENDTPTNPAVSGLQKDLLAELVFSRELRPQIPKNIISEFTEKVQRTYTGYAPSNILDLYSWINERILIPYKEWLVLTKRIEHENKTLIDDILKDYKAGLKWIKIDNNLELKIYEVDNLPAKKEELFLTAKGAFKRIKSAVTKQDNSLFNLISEWLRYYGPIEPDKIKTAFGLNSEQLNEYTESLLENQIVVIDYLTENSKLLEICDSENLERILRLLRFSKRLSFTALDSEFLPLFLANFQGLTKTESTESTRDNLQNKLDSLMGYPAQAHLWEEDILPARISQYNSNLLNTTILNSQLIWFGCGKEKLSFCFESDIELFKSESTNAADIFPELRGKYSFWDLADFTNLSSEELTDKLWENIWKSNISNDNFEIIRKGIHNKFRVFKEAAGNYKKIKRGNYNKWKVSRPIPGNWYTLNIPDYTPDLMEKEEIIRSRIYILLNRYGILFRELIEKELPVLKWSNIFRSLRLMELSGEILSGHFFKGIPSIQFISHKAFRLLQKKLPEDSVYWMNAADPASLCGIKLDTFKNKFPGRLNSNHLVFHGKELVLTSNNKGKKLNIYVPPKNKNLKNYLRFFKVLLERQFRPLKKIKVEFINNIPVLESPYINVLVEFGFAKDYKAITLRPLF